VVGRSATRYTFDVGDTLLSGSRIRILPDLLVNKIAAGEVIERPASVIKELVENAIDAGGTHIAVTIEDGGKQLIRVSDDGCGMNPEDLRLAIAPHATSKIITEEDLFRVTTLGFRGEALASIGAISRLRIVSRPTDAEHGAEIVVCAERIEAAQAAASRPGTTIEVRDLFFNVPARRKFLRATATEVGHINDQFARLALAHRSIGFDLNNNGRTTQQLPAGRELPERIATLFGADLASALIRIERAERDLIIEAYVAPPAVSRSSPTGQYIFLNGRYIRDKFVQHALREAYRGLMEHDRHPVVFLYLTIDPVLVDVNVHPTKLEVRWQDSGRIHSQVLAALRDKFLRSDLTPKLRAGAGPSASAGVDQDALRLRAAEYLRQVPPTVGGPSLANSPEFSPSLPAGGSRSWDYPHEQRPAAGEGASIWQTVYGRADQSSGAPWDEPAPRPAPLPAPFGLTPQPRRAIQIHNSYLVAETEDGLLIIDQHALHERVMYEKLRAQFTTGPLESQRLLLPETLPATARDIALLQESGTLLAQLGIEAEAFGADSIAVHAFPSALKDVDTGAFLRDLLDRLAEKRGDTSAEEVIHAMLDMMACKAAVKAGDPLTSEEIEALLVHRGEVERSSNCPHGRPTTLRLTLNDLEKQFKRR
jgi:DNA mismatch repair protein MutL